MRQVAIMFANKIQLLKFMDKVIGKPLSRLLPSSTRTEIRHHINTLLIIRPGGIGDAVLLAPAITAFRRAHPECRIDVLAEQRNRQIFQLVPCVDTIYGYDSPRDLLKAISKRYDAVVDTEQWHYLSACLARLVRAGARIGYATNDRKKLFSHAIPYSQDHHEIKNFFCLFEQMDSTLPHHDASPFLQLPKGEFVNAEQQTGVHLPESYVVIFPGASIKERRWDVNNFREVAAYLCGKGLPVIVIGGKDCIQDGNAIVKHLDGLNLAGKTSLTETAAIIDRAALLISGDSGILHIGAGMGTPTISFFGPGIERKWAPRGPRHIVINKHLSCSPCTRFGYTPRCPILARCMSDITSDEVIAAIEKSEFLRISH